MMHVRVSGRRRETASRLALLCVAMSMFSGCLELCKEGCPEARLQDGGGAGGEGGSGGSSSSCPNCDIPAEASELASFLRTGQYREFRRESTVHPSAGPHGMVRTYLGTKLVRSLEKEALTHPLGAGAVAELYAGDELAAFAAFVKTAEDSEAGLSIYWYESSDQSGEELVADGLGEGACVSCHSASERDFVLTRFPLEQPLE